MNKSFYLTILAECGDEQNIPILSKASPTIRKIGMRETRKDRSDWKSILTDIDRFLDSSFEGEFFLRFGVSPPGKSIHRAFLEWAAENAAD